MKASEFKGKIDKASSETLYIEFEKILKKHGVQNVTVTSFEIKPNFAITDNKDEAACNKKPGYEWVCKDKRGNPTSKCRCLKKR